MDSPANDVDAENYNKITEDIEVLNIEGYEGYEDECIIVLRTKKENYREAFDTVKKAGQSMRHPSKDDEPSGSQPRLESRSALESLSSSEIQDRVECVRLEGYENIRDGLYILFRMQEKKQKDNGDEISATISTEGDHNVSPTSSSGTPSSDTTNVSYDSPTSNIGIPNTDSTTVSDNDSTNESNNDRIITYHDFINLLENLKNPSGFSFDEVKAYLLTKGVVNSKQLHSYLYRATEKNILEKSSGGDKHYTFKI